MIVASDYAARRLARRIAYMNDEADLPVAVVVRHADIELVTGTPHRGSRRWLPYQPPASIIDRIAGFYDVRLPSFSAERLKEDIQLCRRALSDAA